MTQPKICPQCGESFGPDERFCPKDGSALRLAGGGDSLIGQVIADRYQILRALGEGGMGRVYLAEHVRMGRKSAVKVMSPNLALAADAISRFNREAANASRINHPNVAQIYDFGETADGTLYLAMEFVEGETLRSLIEREGALPPARAAAIAKQIADGLGAAHHLGIVHRDLKPDNVMIGRHHDGSDWVKLVDFGIAKTVQGGERGSQTVTTAGVSIGTPEYMSPEQLAGDRLDNRTDVYSLGLVFFNMLTGDLPYPRVTSKDTLVRRLTTRPRTLSEVVPNRVWPPSLQAALDKSLAPELDDRYANVAEFGGDVMAVSQELGALGQTVPVQSLPRSASASYVPGLTPTVAVPGIRPPSAATGASLVSSSSQPTTIASSAVTPTSSGGRGARIAIFTGLVVVAAGGGALFALRGRSAQTSAAPSDTTKSQVSAPAPVASVAAPVDSAKAATSPPSSNTAAEKSTKAAEASAKKTSAAQLAGGTSDSTARPSQPPPATTSPASPQATSSAPVSAEPLPNGREKKLGGRRQIGVNALGDSGAGKATTDLTDNDRIRRIGGDLQAHFGRANAFIKQGEVPKARAEFRDAAQAMGIMRQLYGGTPAEVQVERLVRQGMTQTLENCRTAQADSATKQKFPPTFHCESLFPPTLRPQGRGRANQPPPFFRER